MTVLITVGMGATEVYPQDRYPYVITKISESGKTVTLEPLHTVSTKTGHSPARFSGQFPVWDHEYSPEELESFQYSEEEKQRYLNAHVTTEKFPITVRLTKRGWRRGGQNGTPFILGTARYLRDYSY